ncbi:hypothetical protein Syun_025411 [Stephania yunnanensis]|uniref:Uncharacterized protein n=1 Tax=Stephania yunnanensis TaxID=152371 RepID=A0AAP0ES57_9MAGN
MTVVVAVQKWATADATVALLLVEEELIDNSSGGITSGSVGRMTWCDDTTPTRDAGELANELQQRQQLGVVQQATPRPRTRVCMALPRLYYRDPVRWS